MCLSRIAVASLVLALSGLTVQAQPNLIVSGKGSDLAGSPSATMSVDLRTYSVEWSAPTPWMVPTVTADGRYLVAFVAPGSTPDSQLWMLDRVTGAVSTIPLGTLVPRELRAHPRRFELYVLMADGTVASVTTGSVRPIYTCPEPGGMDLSGDGARLVLTCDHEIVVLDANSGSLVSRFQPLGSSLPGYDPNLRSPVANFDGSGVLLAAHFVVPPIDDLMVVQLAPGGPSKLHISPALLFGQDYEGVSKVVAATASRDAVLVSTSWHSSTGSGTGNRSLLVDFSTLAVRKVMPLVGGGHCVSGTGSCLEPSTGAFTPDGRHVIVGAPNHAYASHPARAWLQLADVEANALLASAEYFGVDVSLALASAPLAPVNATAAVSSRDVTVSWSLPPESPAVTGYVLEAGSAPGLANLAVIAVDADQPSLHVANVPPGRYYVRVRGRNVTGTSGPSNEILVEIS